MMEKPAIIFIPARMESKRFPGKVLAPLAGKPLIEWVYRGALESNLSNGVYVVTNSEEIAKTVERFGGSVLLIKKDYECGTDRIADVVDEFDAEIIVNLQGDEPLVKGDVLDELIKAMLNSDAPMGTLARRIKTAFELQNPNVVKVVCDKNGFALYFSRSIIPYNVKDSNALRHIGIYAFRKKSIKEFVSLPKGILEEIERLEQLRALEAGWKIKVVLTDREFIGIDTPEDLKLAEEFIMENR